MQIDVFTSPLEITESNVRGRTVVVIDVLRTCSSLLTAMSNGCREVFPVQTIERALNLHSALFESDILLCGEQDGVKIEGFHLGNSPFEYSRDVVENKSLIFTSSNGSEALVKTRGSSETLICGFQNIDVIAEEVRTNAEDLVIVCAGNNNHFSSEDVVCAGMLIDRITALENDSADLSDSAEMALHMYTVHKSDLMAMVRNSNHGKNLIMIGMEKDLEYCVEVNSIPLLLKYVEGKIMPCS